MLHLLLPLSSAGPWAALPGAPDGFQDLLVESVLMALLKELSPELGPVVDPTTQGPGGLYSPPTRGLGVSPLDQTVILWLTYLSARLFSL